ncbi:maleate cis-trans isomerase family protein [Pseudoponticoccus marisrubri]|uniref:Asp/Glu racemase n=1 Tax=Pseudoponticoccus marisrubri TaxID=1685382 RepID=A0A0W7WIS7_9RHOB|nr:Asp/Glu racemase [Pseudoponticoccus marisrubri]KUF10447.1 Asp/Glu racemase [Pseudoponticoccus marisrubri]
MSRPYTLVSVPQPVTLGLIVLQVDETVEQDMRHLFPPGEVALHVTRIPSGADLTPETIADMAAALPAAAALLPAAASFDAIAYACTSGTRLSGAARVGELIRSACGTRAVTNPMTGTLAALAALEVRRVAVVSPYIAAVAQPICDGLAEAGHLVTHAISFGEQVEARVARIAPASILEAVLEAGQAPGTEAVFVSCTNLRALEIVAEAEAALGLPVVTSNLALGWHMARLSGRRLPEGAPGRLARL